MSEDTYTIRDDDGNIYRGEGEAREKIMTVLDIAVASYVAESGENMTLDDMFDADD